MLLNLYSNRRGDVGWSTSYSSVGTIQQCQHSFSQRLANVEIGIGSTVVMMYAIVGGLVQDRVQCRWYKDGRRFKLGQQRDVALGRAGSTDTIRSLPRVVETVHAEFANDYVNV